MDASVWAIVLAGGGGNRFGGLKQFAQLGGQTLLERVVQLTGKCCAGVVVVLPAGHDRPEEAGQIVATGGATRAESVRSGLAALPADAGIVVITDAAHPLASIVLYERVIEAVRAGADGALPGLPLADAIKRVEPDEAETGSGALLALAGATTAAGGHVSAQMPMAFRLEALRGAHARVGDAVEDSAMITADGGRVVIVPGEPTNVHVTTPAELAIAEALLPLV
jgi:2-C-methyl-D-erythritol 4-phosphate cytidylyltransferase